ncbi:CCHC-type domain-containing protein [Trichonephila clavipes]|nr:CCHC-type domain-containing protein [Trichonephila clavipes]
MWRTADNRPVCFHCGRPGHVMRYCRERLSLTTLETADGTSTTLALKKKYADQTLLAVLRQVPRGGRSPIRRYRSPSPYRRSSQSPGRRSEEN